MQAILAAILFIVDRKNSIFKPGESVIKVTHI